MEEAPVVASAIALPEFTEPSQPDSTDATTTPSLKRRQSDTSDTDSKRRRISTDDDAVKLPSSPPRDPERRKSRQIEERKRGQRLFGALLGTLSQGSSNAAQKRRADIEKRQQAKLKAQTEEDEARRRERLENLMVVRRREQRKYEERTIRLRHKNMLHFAKFLRTKTEPRLYYKPWELTPDQEDEIQRQIEEAQSIIDNELDGFERQQERTQDEDRRPSAPAREEPEDPELSKMDIEPAEEEKAEIQAQDEEMDNAQPTSGEPEKEPTTAETRPDDSPATSATAVNEPVAEEELRDAMEDDQGETVVEAEEDTVIY